ncbi:MAG TPA: dephospho-CoA kinase [Saprospiraceae bacterium]|jgi:dephospho-CoA kinase|nr:MAG: dephospho-CoA kinase [Candidatus Parvibacillus calidus]MBX2935779.1 dephospho-CoA kinase [Saprospiraceae bacterium]MBK7740267.1 dephospho-CoA kinase [Candidatus Parvibacillus calidus]MBX7179882.1 dephospho-CoA kinase [Saprospiraceae bacterium]MCB0592049.1 dephospho-CoA kinase [Saprospiraceae bacterium]
MLKIGITGGIASGKSFVASMFELLGIPVYYADKEAKRLIVEDSDIRRRIIDLLGEESYRDDGSYNTQWVASVVFSDHKKLLALNAIVHPVVKQDYLLWHSRMHAAYTLHESALILEGGFNYLMDRIIVVTAPIEMRLDRLISRDGISRKAGMQKIQSQSSDEQKLKLADFVIKNDGHHSLINQVLDIHHALKRLSA